MSPAVLDAVNNALAGGPLGAITNATSGPWTLPAETPVAPDGPEKHVVFVPKPVDIVPDGTFMPDTGLGDGAAVPRPQAKPQPEPPVMEAAPHPVFALLPQCADLCNTFDEMWRTCASDANNWMCGDVCSGGGDEAYVACRDCSRDQLATPGEIGAIDSAYTNLLKGCAGRPPKQPEIGTSISPPNPVVTHSDLEEKKETTTTTTTSTSTSDATRTGTTTTRSGTTIGTTSKSSTTTKKATRTKATTTPSASQSSFARTRTVPMGLLVAAAGLVFAI